MGTKTIRRNSKRAKAILAGLPGHNYKSFNAGNEYRGHDITAAVLDGVLANEVKHYADMGLPVKVREDGEGFRVSYHQGHWVDVVPS